MKNIVVMFIVGMAFLISSCQEQTQNQLPGANPKPAEVSRQP